MLVVMVLVMVRKRKERVNQCPCPTCLVIGNDFPQIKIQRF